MRLMILLLAVLLAATLSAADLRLGIVGTDTSHVVAFTKLLNDPQAPDHIAGARVVAAWKGGSPDIESSRTRVDRFAEELHDKWNVEIEPDIPALCAKVDAVLIESVDGRAHLNEARQVIAAHKPMFIDKPVASTLADVREIARLAKDANVKWFSSSSYRYSSIAEDMKFPDTIGAIVWGPGPEEEHHQLDLSWYGIHPIELLFTLMGTGCEEVTRIVGANMDDITCRWKNGRLGTVRTLRPYGPPGAVVFRPPTGSGGHGNVVVMQSPAKTSEPYTPLVKHIVEFFQTGEVPVPNEETLEIFEFMDAAQRSKASGGRPMLLH